MPYDPVLEKTLRGQKGKINTISFHHSSQLLASGSTDNSICIWNLKSHKKYIQLEGHKV